MENKKTKFLGSKKFKVAYAFMVVIALGTVMFTKISTEKSLGNIKSLEENEILNQEITENITERVIEEEPVRQNITDIPDTRNEKPTETTEKSKFNTPYEDYYCLPFGNTIIKDFSNTSPVYSKTMGDYRTHNGIDFKGEKGAAIVSIAYGEVISVFDDTLFGTTVLIDHGNGVTAKYCGLNKDTLNVKEHTTLKSEDIIGYLDNVPCETKDGPHLHFEISYNGENVEPLELMGK